jgi:predicted short-subunit dehydrogenase-like oxidoreductase (DUF2520 family)
MNSLPEKMSAALFFVVKEVEAIVVHKRIAGASNFIVALLVQMGIGVAVGCLLPSLP